MNMLFAPEPKAITLREYQADAVQRLREGIRGGCRRQVLVAPTGSGKCLGKGTPVLMFDGTIKAVEDIVTGDLLMGPDSAPRRVLSLARGVAPLYRVTPAKGMSYVVNDDHILSLKITKGATKWDCSRSDQYQAGRIHNISVKDYLAKSNTFRHCAKGWRAGVDFASKGNLPLPPYFFGLWIGDGISRAPAICSADLEIIQETERVAASFGLETNYERPEGNRSVVVHATGRVRGKDNPIRTALMNLGVFGNKHIPLEYLTASRDDRLELLAGLLDTDGSLSGGGYDFIQKSERIANETAYLARSLGFAAYVNPSRKTCSNNGVSGDYWRVSISGDCTNIPVRLGRRKAPPRLIKKDPLVVGIKVDAIGDGEYFGFEIDGDKLFLLGDFTVTHNTEMAMNIVKESQRKGASAWFIVDRIALIDQTSDRFAQYGIDHGIIQADHWLTDRSKPVQIASAQTIARRKFDVLPDLIVIDEAHCRYKSTAEIVARAERAKVIGLTATPFTAGMAEDWDGLVNTTTVNKLLAEGYLAPLKIKACVAPDMTGAKKKFTGEYEDEEAGTRGLTIIGDVVQTWIEQTRKHFGGPAKTIVFSPSVAHGAELCRQFSEAGFNFQQLSYLDNGDDERRAKIAEFRKPDSVIHGLVSCAVLTKGFDVPDCLVGISCRPYRKSFSSHIQEMGRVMRTAPGKEYGLWLDHSGNAIAFADDTAWLFEYGVDSLSDAQKRDSEVREPKEKTRKERFCGCCGMAMEPGAMICASCGWEKPQRGEIEIVQGELIDLDLKVGERFSPRKGLRAECLKDPKAVFNAALSYATYHTRKGPEAARKWAMGIWFGIYDGAKPPRGFFDSPVNHGRVIPEQWSLIEREVTKFRRSNKRSAA